MGAASDGNAGAARVGVRRAYRRRGPIQGLRGGEIRSRIAWESRSGSNGMQPAASVRQQAAASVLQRPLTGSRRSRLAQRHMSRIEAARKLPVERFLQPWTVRQALTISEGRRQQQLNHLLFALFGLQKGSVLLLRFPQGEVRRELVSEPLCALSSSYTRNLRSMAPPLRKPRTTLRGEGVVCVSARGRSRIQGHYKATTEGCSMAPS